MDIMRQDDRARSRFTHDSVRHDRRARPFPIERIDIPQHDLVAELIMDPSLLVRRDISVRRTEIDRPLADRVFDRVIRPAQLTADGVVRHLVKVWVGPAVIGDFVAFPCGARDDFRMFGNVLADNEESHLDVARREKIEQTWSQFFARSIVKGHRYIRPVNVDRAVGDVWIGRRGFGRRRRGRLRSRFGLAESGGKERDKKERGVGKLAKKHGAAQVACI